MKTRHRLSQHFVIEEFDCHDGTKVPLNLVRGYELWCEWWGEPMRRMFGPVIVTSGYRTPSANAAVGGAKSSVHLGRSTLPNDRDGRHLRAAAADVHTEEGDVAAWHAWAIAHRAKHPHLGFARRGGVGRYDGLRFVHLDTWAERDWRG